jgi:polar amino acid transport system substrate-binding protein
MAKYGKFVALLAIAALAVGALALVGCTTPATPTTPTEATSTPAVDLKLVTPGTLTAGSDTAFPPFESMNGNVAEGFDVDLLTAMAKEAGINTVVFKTEIFDTLIPTLKAGGKFDVIASGMTIKAERQVEIDFTNPYFDSNQSVAMKVGGKYTAPADLKGKKVGVQSGTTGESWANENLKPAGAKIVPFKDAVQAFSALQAGNVDAVINDLPVSAEVVKDPSKGLAIIAQIPTGEQYGFGVSKENPALLVALNTALAKVRTSGEYDTIFTKWFGNVPK